MRKVLPGDQKPYHRSANAFVLKKPQRYHAIVEKFFNFLDVKPIAINPTYELFQKLAQL